MSLEKLPGRRVILHMAVMAGRNASPMTRVGEFLLTARAGMDQVKRLDWFRGQADSAYLVASNPYQVFK